MEGDREFCCEMMKDRMSFPLCPIHGNLCPDIIMARFSDGRFGIPIHDGGSSMIVIQYCPWCGSKCPPDNAPYAPHNPESLRLATEYWEANPPGTSGYMVWLAGVLDELHDAFFELGVDIGRGSRPDTPTWAELLKDD